LKPSIALPRDPWRAVLTAAYLGTVILSWGSNYVLMKLALPSIAPLAFAAIRVAGAGVVVAGLLALARRDFLPVPAERLPLAAIALLQVAGILGLSILGLRYVSAGRAAVLVYTMQLWAMPLGHWLVGDRVAPRQVIGGIIGFAGLALYFNPALIDWHDRRALLGNGLLILAAMSWALGACLYRRRTWRSGLWSQTFWQMATGAIPLALAAAASWERPIAWSAGLLAIFVFNWLIATALAYWCWTQVLTMMSAATAGQVLMLTPMVGYVLSSVVFGDPLTPGVLICLGLILAGLTLTVGAKQERKRHPAEP